MVFFSCEGCNESLKKNQVEKHVYSCKAKNCWAVTCVDCSKTFEVSTRLQQGRCYHTKRTKAEPLIFTHITQGDTYAAHTTCISEAQKYEGALYKGGKTGKAPKRNPQVRRKGTLWYIMIKNTLQTT
jgi:cell growth-regulating nucleolar protein